MEKNEPHFLINTVKKIYKESWAQLLRTVILATQKAETGSWFETSEAKRSQDPISINDSVWWHVPDIPAT
jgi:hypothetical protein